MIYLANVQYLEYLIILKLNQLEDFILKLYLHSKYASLILKFLYVFGLIAVMRRGVITYSTNIHSIQFPQQEKVMMDHFWQIVWQSWLKTGKYPLLSLFEPRIFVYIKSRDRY